MILEKIVADNLRELEERKQKLPLRSLNERIAAQPSPSDFATAIKGDGIKLIAEVKKASPSKGIIRNEFDPVTLAETYAGNGAAAISVLTETNYFQGSLDDLGNIRKALNNKIPLLRKDFIHDRYQVYEARAYGADAVLLIAAILTEVKLRELLEVSRDLRMDCLVEVHNEKEIELVLKSKARIIGINNRDLKTFSVDLKTTERLRPRIPEDRIVVSESGVHNRDDILRLQNLGVDAVLIGEAFMSAKDIRAKMRELL